MATDSTNSIFNGTSGSSASASKSATGTLTGKKDNEQIGKNEFLQLLVTQLKNQDPMDPMKSDQFAVNLAQFSQLEQLISINDRLGQGAGTDTASLAAYLGQEVSLSDDTIHVSAGDGGGLKLDLAHDASDVRINLLNSSGQPVRTVFTGALSAGKHSLQLKNLDVANGDYKFEVTAQSTVGGSFNPKANVSGVVTGFVPGADPSLMIGDRETKPAKVVAVGIPSSASPGL